MTPNRPPGGYHDAMVVTIRASAVVALAMVLATATPSCDDASDRDPQADRERMADDLMRKMNELEEEASAARHVVILVEAGDEPSEVRRMLLSGRWLMEDEVENLPSRLPLEVASGLTEQEAERLADSLRNLGARVETALNPLGEESPGEDVDSDGEEEASAATGNKATIPAAWLDRTVGPDDRRWFNEVAIGYAPPPLADDVYWVNGDALSWADLLGQIVIVQTWTTATQEGRNALSMAETIRDRARAEVGKTVDVAVIALHTPEKAESARSFLTRRVTTLPVAVDPSGRTCDALGVWKRPVNMIVDRQGVVRAMGLNAEGLRRMVRRLASEEFDPTIAPPARPASTTESVAYPPVTKTQIRARDVRGRLAPPLHVSEYVTPAPDLTGKVVAVDFWATWHAPCRASIPHLNDLQRMFPEGLAVVGLSNESPETVRRFMANVEMDYAVGVDPARRTANALDVRAIPQMLIYSADGVVRWQGHPGELTEETLGAIVAANRARVESGPGVRRRWTAGAERD